MKLNYAGAWPCVRYGQSMVWPLLRQVAGSWNLRSSHVSVAIPSRSFGYVGASA